MNFVKKKVFASIKDTMTEYLYDFDESKFDVAWWSGTVELRNLIIKPSRVNEDFKKSGSPIALKAGLISHIKF